MQVKRFQKKTENFVCEKCGEKNIGTGFTNHCSKCLWSKHVDVNPGDRAESCGGMMTPSKIDFEKGKFYIVHKCSKCGIERRKVLEKKDNFEQVLNVAEEKGKSN